MGDSPAYKAATSFDMGAHALFVNREVAAWVEGQARRNPSYLQKACEGQEQRNTTVSLTGTAYSSSILGCVVFDLTFFDEVSRLHETIRNIPAQVSIAVYQLSRAGLSYERITSSVKFLFTSMRYPALNPT